MSPNAPEAGTAAPELAPHWTVSEAMASVCSHLGARLERLASPAAAGVGAAPVHQMRVSVRRGRSALGLFRRAVPCAELTLIGEGLRALGQALGPARDWDVFLAGTVPRLTASDPAAGRRLVAAARRRRQTAYRALRAHLNGEGFRDLLVLLAAAAHARPWEGGVAPAVLAVPVADFGAVALQKRFKRLMAPGADVAGLAEARLHDIRLDAKRMRYAAELFAPLYAGKRCERFIARLAALQDRLGLLNDAAVAARLLAILGRAGDGAGGALAADAGGLRAEIARAWRRLRVVRRFWD